MSDPEAQSQSAAQAHLAASQPPTTFTELLNLDEVAADLFIGLSPLKGRPMVYGGQVVAQALWAATKTVPPEHTVHSLHSYFIRAGDEKRPIVFDVDRIRDGRSFSTRRVVARQAGGAIFNLSASFHKSEPDVQFAKPTPALDVASASECEGRPWDDISEVRTVPDTEPGRVIAWIKIAKPKQLPTPDNPAGRACHAAALAYCSDHIPMGAIRSGHPSTADWEGFMGASLDHTVWFHRPTRADKWLLFDMQLQSLQGSRGVAHGTVHSSNGELVATIAQEGLLRPLN